MDNTTAQSGAADAAKMTKAHENPVLSATSVGAGDSMVQGDGAAKTDSQVSGSTMAPDSTSEKQPAARGGLGGDGSPRARTALGELPVTGLPFGLQALPVPSSFGNVAGTDAASGAACWVAAKRARSPDQENQEPNKRQHLQPDTSYGRLPAPDSASEEPACPMLNPAVESLLADLEKAINSPRSSSPAAASSVHPARAAMLAAAEAEVRVPWNKLGAEDEELKITGANQLPLGAVYQDEAPKKPSSMISMISPVRTRSQPYRATHSRPRAAFSTVRKLPQPKVSAQAPVLKKRIIDYKLSGRMRDEILTSLQQCMSWGDDGKVKDTAAWEATNNMVDKMLASVEDFEKERLSGGGHLTRAYTNTPIRDSTRGEILSALCKGMGWSGGGVELNKTPAWKATKAIIEKLLFSVEEVSGDRRNARRSLLGAYVDARARNTQAYKEDPDPEYGPRAAETGWEGSKDVVIKKETPVKMAHAGAASEKLVQPAVARIHKVANGTAPNAQARRDSGVSGMLGAEGSRTMRGADFWPSVTSDIDSYRPSLGVSAARSTIDRNSAAAETNVHPMRAAAQSERRDSYRPLSVVPSHAERHVSSISSRSGVQASPYFAGANHYASVPSVVENRHPAFDPPIQLRPNGLPLAEYACSPSSAYNHRGGPEPASLEYRARKMAGPTGTSYGYHGAPEPATSEHGARWAMDSVAGRGQYASLNAALRHAPGPAPNEHGARRFLEASVALDQSAQRKQTTTAHDYEDYMSRVKRGGNYSLTKPEGRMFLDYD